MSSPFRTIALAILGVLFLGSCVKADTFQYSDLQFIGFGVNTFGADYFVAPDSEVRAWLNERLRTIASLTTVNFRDNLRRYNAAYRDSSKS